MVKRWKARWKRLQQRVQDWRRRAWRYADRTDARLRKEVDDYNETSNIWVYPTLSGSKYRGIQFYVGDFRVWIGHTVGVYKTFTVEVTRIYKNSDGSHSGEYVVSKHTYRDTTHVHAVQNAFGIIDEEMDEERARDAYDSDDC